MNPPYGRVVSSVKRWREGSVTSAALFVERAAELCAPETQIAALLPEVLRTGSSYKQWRTHIGKFAARGRSQSIGLFSNHADVDVFIQYFRKRGALIPSAAAPRKKSPETVADHFLVAVGAVIPHRHPPAGPEFAYLHARNAIPWGEICRISETRMFKGRTFTPPFVLVRRTSRPGDTHRAIATLVLGKRRVAVENHLIAVLPKRGSVEICRALMRILRSPDTDAWFDLNMRCRHLTTGSVSSLPWT